MKLYQKLMTRIAKSMPARSRHQLIETIDLVFDLARKEHYGNHGEDAFVQAYFRQQAVFAGAPFHIMKNIIAPGFYVDVGAYSPRHLSNTYWFYKQGWCGINIDATPGSMHAFERIRPRDFNIEAAVSTKEGNLTFYTWNTPRYVNTASPEHAALFTRVLGRPPLERQVATSRLETLIEQCLPQDQKISFMSIDVESCELDVLQSNSWSKYRPELLLVESHLAHIGEVVSSDITRFMAGVDYEMYAWIKPTVVYREVDLPDPLVV